MILFFCYSKHNNDNYKMNNSTLLGLQKPTKVVDQPGVSAFNVPLICKRMIHLQCTKTETQTTNPVIAGVLCYSGKLKQTHCTCF